MPILINGKEHIELEEHFHNTNMVYGKAAAAPLIAERGSTVPLQIEGGNNAYGISQLLFKERVDGGEYYDIGRLIVTAVDTANAVSIIQIYHGTPGSAVAYAGEADDDVVTAAGHGLSNGDRFIFDTLNDETYGVVTSQVYYARDVSGDTFKVAEISGGDAIDITTDITGNIKKLSSPTLNTEVLVHMASVTNDSRPFEVPAKYRPITEAAWITVKSASGASVLISFFIDIHTY